jgi:hypothetical protein
MRRTVVMSAVIVLGGLAWAWPSLPARATKSLLDQSALLPAAAGPGLLHQCSRRTIEAPDSYWVVTIPEATVIEHALLSYLARPEVRKPSRPLEEYFRQYIGVIAGGRRLVYVSFFHRSYFEDAPDEKERQMWRTEPVEVCDGGDHYWGIVYDVDKATFHPPEFNGEV